MTMDNYNIAQIVNNFYRDFLKRQKKYMCNNFTTSLTIYE